MGKLVFIQNDRVLTDSLTVAEVFEIKRTENNLDLPIFKKDVIDSEELIETAILLSYKEPLKLERNLKLVKLASYTKEWMPFLLNSVELTIMKNFKDSLPKEKDIYIWFKENFNKILGKEYKITTRKNNPKHIPDFWLIKNDEYVPVEIKLNSFDNRNMEQLGRYMDFYECSEGIAVGKELNCTMPYNVTFISHENADIKELTN